MAPKKKSWSHKKSVKFFAHSGKPKNSVARLEGKGVRLIGKPLNGGRVNPR